MIRVEAAELEKALRIWLTIMAQRQPSLIRDLWTRRGDEYDAEKINRTRREFARVLTQRFLTANWDIMRSETPRDEWFRDLDEKQLTLPRLIDSGRHR
jgi:hypothetical protein